MNTACPVCGSDALEHATREQTYRYKNHTTVIPAVTADYCSNCGEAILDAEESVRVNTAMLAFNRQVNAALVDSQFITHVRKKLALDQQEAAKIFGGGVNAFSRYETGKSSPPVALVKLLKVLDRHPELLDEIQ